MDDRNNRYGPYGQYGPTGYQDTGSPGDYTRDYGSGRDYTHSSARDYAASGQLGGGRDRSQRDDGTRSRADWRDQDRSSYGAQGYGQRRQERGGSNEGDRDWSDYGSRSYSNYGGYSGQDRDRDYGARDEGRMGSRDWGSRDSSSRSYGRPEQGRYGQDRDRSRSGEDLRGYDRDRGFFDRAGDEVRSWFGDEEAERRREYDSRMDERAYGQHDDDYHSWRRGQIQSLDRDYDEYRRENRSKFESEFGAWRTNRQTQRASLNQVEEHMDVVGSDGEHVGTVDKVRGDRIVLTKNDADAGGRHHSIPSSWLKAVDTKVTLSKSAAEAKAAWRDEERNQAMFGEQGNNRGGYGTQANSQASGSATAQAGSQAGTQSDTQGEGGKTLNRSFSGTY